MAGKKHGKTPTPEVLDRELAVVELRRTGETWDRIARAIGYANAAGAYKAYKRAVVRTLQQPTDELREMELDRLDRLQRAYWKDAIEGNHKSAEFVLKLIGKRAELLGLDAPQKIQAEVITYDGNGDIDGDIERIIRLLDQMDKSSAIQVEAGTSEIRAITAGE
jgi:hypothetical protein